MAAHVQAISAQPAQTGTGEGAPTQPEPIPPERSPAHYLWAVWIARIYEVFPPLCHLSGGQMGIIAFITHSADIRQILDHIGVEPEPSNMSPARGPSLWDACNAPVGEGVEREPYWDLAAQPAPEFDVDQRVNWWLNETASQVRCGEQLHLWRAESRTPPQRVGNQDHSRRILRKSGGTLAVFAPPNPCSTWSHAVEFPIRSCRHGCRSWE